MMGERGERDTFQNRPWKVGFWRQYFCQACMNILKNTWTENKKTAHVKTYLSKTKLSLIDTPLEISCNISNGGVVMVTSCFN